MGVKSRINRPTTATPRKDPPGRYVWVSTPYGHVPRHMRQRRLGLPVTGMTYRPNRDALPR